MRIAVTGTHGSGKTTLIEDFVEAHPDYEPEEEPYWGLAQRGIPFSDGPSLPDLEEQLAASAELILARAEDPQVIFDRSPIDFIAYLEVIGERAGIDWSPSGRLLRRIERALGALDLVVFVPLTIPDEIGVRIEFPRLRASVDHRLKALVRDDSLGFFEAASLPVLEATGTRPERLSRLSQAIAEQDAYEKGRDRSRP
jgi:hypothetical protein